MWEVRTINPGRGTYACHYEGMDEDRARQKYDEVRARLVVGATIELAEGSKVHKRFTRKE